MRFIYDDGGHNMYAPRAIGDCAIRAMAIANNMNYLEVRNLVLDFAQKEKGTTKRSDGRSYTRLETIKRVMRKLGWDFVDIRKKPVKFESFENKKGAYVIWAPWHFTTIIDGDIHDMFDQREEDNRVKGYWYKRE